jgi:predicted nuclease of predicted toxin-antitoxin system
MKLLFDQNLSPRLVEVLQDVYPGSMHVRQLRLEKADDVTVWHVAAALGFTIVSKDSDFRQRSFVFGAPPRVIWIGLGDASTTEIQELLRNRFNDIDAFCNDSEASFLVLQ